MSDMSIEPSIPELQLQFNLFIEVGKPEKVDTSDGPRMRVPILGGEVFGERLHGRILPGGADNLRVREDGCNEIDASYVIEARDGARIDVRDQGYRHGPAAIMQALASGRVVDPGEYYFRTCMRLSSAAIDYDWVNRTLFVGSGARGPDRVRIDVYAVR